MKLLVTGGAGFIGSNFILYWLNKYPEDKVVNLDSLTYAGNLENLTSVEQNPNYTFILGDITDPEVVKEAMNGIDTVVHFAAESHVDRSILAASQFVMTNVVGTQVLLDAARESGIKRFHHVSTDEVFGSIGKGKFSEQSPYDPRSPYSASKAASDHLVYAYFHTYKLPVTLTNCTNNFGPYQFPEKFIPLAITNILENKHIPVYGDGLHIRDWLYVEDHCRAIDVVLQKGKVGSTYCVGGMTQDITNIDVIRKICTIMNKDESLIKYIKDRPGHDRRYAVDWSKIQKELGWEPKHDFDTWLKKTVQWYTDHQSWWKHVKTGEYQSYYKKQYGDISGSKPMVQTTANPEPGNEQHQDTYIVTSQNSKKSSAT